MRRNGAATLAVLSLSLVLAACGSSPQATPQASDRDAGITSRPGAAFVAVNWLTEWAPEQHVKAEVRDGLLIFQDDIILGEHDGHLGGQGTYTTNTARRWSGGTIPYTFNAALPTAIRDRVRQAATNIAAQSNLRLVARTTQRDYVEFTYNTGTSCASSLGRLGGRQTITLADRCSVGSIMHEVGHAAGLYHEQTRPDRDQSVRILWANIPADWQSQYQIASGSAGSGAYDFDSIMHYPAYFDGKLAIQPLNSSIDLNRMGQRNGYSVGDKAIINALYPR